MGGSPKHGASADEEPRGPKPPTNHAEELGARRPDSSHSAIRPTAPRAPGIAKPALPPPPRVLAKKETAAPVSAPEPSPPASSPAATPDATPTLPPPSPDVAPSGSARPRPEELNTQELVLRTAAPAPIESDAPAFARFGRFDLLGRVAVGGMAEILLARDSIEGAGSRQVIIKAVRGEFAEDGDFAKMFLDEGRLAMRLTHPNICTVYQCGRHNGRFFIAMEYVHGHTLREMMVRAAKRGRAMPIPLLLRIFALVAEALDYAHRAKDSQGRELAIVHRDVSPHNIMIRYDGVVKLLDFGVAKAAHGQHSTESGALKGKFSYMSPEQALGDPVDSRADVFALGVCIFESVTGRRLFHRKAQYDTLKAILEVDPPPLSAFRDDVPDELEAIVKRALAKDPEQRYQRAADLAHDLEGLLGGLRAVASTARIGELMEELFQEEARRGPELEVDDDLRSRYAEPARAVPIGAGSSRVWIAIGSVGLLLGLGIGGALLASGGSEEPTPTAPVATPDPAVRAPVETSPLVTPIAATPLAEPGDATLCEPAPAEVAEPEREEGAFRTSSTRPTKRRRGRGSGRARGTVIVTDPGF